ncbi:P-loop containing nucleoside triphosphate hydrolase protein [Bimuria novae-zelandiae CBS 107.79]|uniref:P-loop containing nucleoside triphosphate hydrolase protein n=1 Tax=Bimuria novae-zelandiae CBS 107.79 TaxID=1447943 RepID=A0A6A5UY55_9PLEO|nr:P-loop containing nucleoside triphosphate hydrolase protein [Bimuria novae-zelandiae CBS 107.79]
MPHQVQSLEKFKQLAIRRAASASSTSSSEAPIELEVPKPNGIKAGTDKNDAKDVSKPDETEDEEPCDPGMKTGIKDLYSGKEDKKGRYQWQETEPEDLGVAVENDKTAKWSLLVRHVKVYQDPSKVLAIHSIVVQSPLLKKLLGSVLKNYPGITTDLNRLEFSGKFEPLIHRWAELQAAIAKIGDETEEQRTTKEHANLLQSILVKEFKDLIDTSQDMKNKRVMTYEYLWTLFQPGATLFTRQDGQETALQLQSTKYGQDAGGNPCFWVVGKFVDWDGSSFGTSQINVSVSAYVGTRSIPHLRVFPLEYHPKAEEVKARLIERGSKVEELAGVNYKAYDGVAWHWGEFGSKNKYQVKGRIVIDTYGWNHFDPGHAIYTTRFATNDAHDSDGESDDGDEDDGAIAEGAESAEDDDYFEPGYDDYADGMPLDGHFADEEDAAKRPPLTTEQKLICTPLLRGYSLKNKMWLNFFVNCVKEIEWQKDAFDRLVLPKNQKELILGFTESQQEHRAAFDDVIEGKGRGMIILLCGPPGVGKTLTAESVAEEMKVPLYMMSAGDLGLDPRRIESKLHDTLEMCTRWNSVLLLDEADVFLEERSLHELERNKLVSIFLRVLEYFEGTMFLTTNRVNTFDPAFASRIHISLNYKELSNASRRTVWKNFLDSSPQAHVITTTELDELSRLNMNGRQIKNILKIARLLATRKGTKLNRDDILTTLEVTQHLHNESQVTERTRGTLYG